MATDILTAVVAKVQFGTFEINGLMFPDGSYGVAVPQMVDLNLVPPNRSRKQIESLLGMTFKTHQKAKTSLNSKAVNTISLLEFEKALAKLDRSGNLQAQTFRDGLVGLSLHQLFSDAFGVKFEAEDRQKWLECRFNTKHDFRPLTDQLQAHGFKEPWEYGKFIHAMQEKVGMLDGSRDIADFKTLHRLEKIQDKLTIYMECGVKPYEALKKIV